MITQPKPTHEAERLRGRVAALTGALRDSEAERLRLRRKRRQELALVAIGISLVVHVGLMLYLSSRLRAGEGGTGPEPMQYEFAILSEEELTELESLEYDDAEDAGESALEDLPDSFEAAELDPVVSAASLDVAAAGALPSLGGAGGGDLGGDGLSGAGAGTSFFGVSSRGQRFAFIVDRSGSMGEEQKMRVAMRELARSVGSLPDYASFYVLLFSTDAIAPPFQRGWTQARRQNIGRLIRWLNDVDPDGGTQPLSSFRRVFSLDTRPDVIFFLTDGVIPNRSVADTVRELNTSGKRVVINTIAFGDPGSQDMLKQMAAESGGSYRFVSTGGR